MTDIATMPAGPELDRLIAEKVMEWNGVEHADGIVVYNSGRIVRPTRWDCRDWAPSTDITHAWEAIDSLRPIEVTVQMRILTPSIIAMDTRWVTEWLCKMEIRPVGRPAIVAESHADSQAMAICRAALNAVRS